MARTHKQRTVQIVFDRARHALNGLPTYAFCNGDFTRWEGLSAHITHRRCERLPDSLAFEPLAVAAGEAAVDNSLSEAAAAASISRCYALVCASPRPSG